jgi:hypothetical protein
MRHRIARIAPAISADFLEPILHAKTVTFKTASDVDRLQLTAKVMLKK